MAVSVLRPVTVDDADALAVLYRRNRSFLQPWEPQREEPWYTPAGQRSELTRVLADVEAGRAASFLIMDGDTPAGQITLSSIRYGASLSADIRFWVALDHNGRGLATAAVLQVQDHAFSTLGLHRLETATVPHNIAAQHVLVTTGFTRIGRAPEYLRINGRWQDHVLYQRLAD